MTRFESLLRSGLGSAALGDPPSSPESHLDADQLSAFVENKMSGPAAVIAHASRCRDCREILFLMSGETMPAAPASGRSIPRWAWIPATAAVCAFSIGIAFLLTRGSHPPIPVIARLAPRPQKPPANPVMPGGSTPSTTPILKKPVIPEPKASKENVESTPSVVRADTPSPPLFTSHTQADQPRQQAKALDLTQGILPAAPPQQISPAQDVPQQQNSVASSAQRSARPMGVLPGLDRVGSQQAFTTIGNGALSLNAMPSTSARRPALWAIHEGVPEVSLDSGLTWRPMPTRQKLRFEAVGNLLNVVWAGGYGGALYESRDGGEHWHPVPVTDGSQTLSSDILEVHVATRVDVRVISANGERWVTDDGGNTWKREQ